MPLQPSREGRTLDQAATVALIKSKLLAGEHTAARWHGLMEGALRSGFRAAQEVEELLAARV